MLAQPGSAAAAGCWPAPSKLNTRAVEQQPVRIPPTSHTRQHFFQRQPASHLISAKAISIGLHRLSFHFILHLPSPLSSALPTTMSRISHVQQENAQHTTDSQHNIHTSSSSPSKLRKPSHSSPHKLPLSPLHYHPNLPHPPTQPHTSPVRERPQLRRRRPAMAAAATAANAGKAGHGRVSSMNRATEVLSQLHFDYSRTKQTNRQHTDPPTAAAASSPLPLEQRYEQWKRFWQSIDTTTGHGQRTHSDESGDTSTIDDDTERLLRWLAFSRQQPQTEQQADGSQQRTASGQSEMDESQEPSCAAPTRSTSPHSPTYYVNLARFLSTAPTQRQRLRPKQPAHTSRTKPAQPQQRPAEERTAGEGSERVEAEEQKVSGGVDGSSERVEIVIDCSDDQHVAQRYKHRPVTTTIHPAPSDNSHASVSQPTATSATATPPASTSPTSSSRSPPPSRPSSAYSFTNLPREHIRPAASNPPKPAPTASSFSLHSYFARMSVAQLQRYLHVFNPSLLSSSLTLTKDQLISVCCTFYRTRIASHRSQPTDQRSEQVKQDVAKDAIVAHTNRTYAHLPLPALLHTIAAATTLASAPAVLSGAGYVDERSVKSGYRRCMMRVHPDKHMLSGWEEQTRCVELFRLVQDKYAHWQRVNAAR